MLTRAPRAFPMSCYVVVEDEGLTLVDSTISSPAAEVARISDELGKPLARILLTHSHSDHAGGVAGVRERFPDAEVAIGRREARLLAGDRALDAGEPQSPVKGSFPKVDWRPDRLLEPGDRSGSLEVVATPGHTPGHIAFLDVRDRTLIAGDAFQTRGGLAVAGVLRLVFPFMAMGTWHRPTALASARAVLDLAPTRLCVGHGEPLMSPAASLERAIAEAERKFKE